MKDFDQWLRDREKELTGYFHPGDCPSKRFEVWDSVRDALLSFAANQNEGTPSQRFEALSIGGRRTDEMAQHHAVEIHNISMSMAMDDTVGIDLQMKAAREALRFSTSDDNCAQAIDRLKQLAQHDNLSEDQRILISSWLMLAFAENSEARDTCLMFGFQSPEDEERIGPEALPSGKDFLENPGIRSGAFPDIKLVQLRP